jgi:hypothetical protein
VIESKVKHTTEETLEILKRAEGRAREQFVYSLNHSRTTQSVLTLEEAYVSARTLREMFEFDPSARVVKEP